MKKLMFLFAIAASCVPLQTPLSPQKVQDCGGACARLRELECRDAQGRALGSVEGDGESCEQFCERKEREGVNMHGACVASAPSCSAANLCFR